uniref:tRNA-splicing endonuclease subunit Sen54 N-terminal domain-containing protein n=1 Tax=Biomphalaria glabrata TaxID=6526 RepID=A0A2C9LER3_BIOGL
MSFYDLCKDSVLSAKDLFKYRVKRDSTIPSKGGQKDFEPNGSWLQAKSLEAFMQERLAILSEPRVEKLKSLVQGEWDSSKCLVNISKPGKFWAHMGFTDEKRNWLFPEEALFLIEANALEVYHDGVPFSVQEAYSKCLGSDVSVEEYQVYSYLQRLGYVVIRHEENPSITPYERKINLDKYLKKRHRLDRKNKSQQKKRASKTSTAVECQSSDTSAPVTIVDLNTIDTDIISSSNGISPLLLNEPTAISENVDKKIVLSPELTKCSSNGDNPSSLEIRNEASQDTLDSNVDERVNGTEHSSSERTVDSLKAVKDGNSIVQSHDCDLTLSENCTTLVPPVVSNEKMPHPEKRNISQVDSINDDSQSKRPRCADEETSHSSSTEEKHDQDQCLHFLSTDNVGVACRKFYSDTWVDCREKLKTEKALKCCSTDETDDEEMHCSKTVVQTEGVENVSNSSVLPDIANTEILHLALPDQKFLPPNVEINVDSGESIFDVSQYKIKSQKNKSKKKLKEEERDARKKNLQFSFPQWIPGHSGEAGCSSKVTFSNWATYKNKIKQAAKDYKASNPVAHYWEGEVTPLVHPSDATSYEAVLNRLSIIESTDNETLTPDPDCMLSIKISYDVHQPDSKFKKSIPGVPHHRVCVSKSSTEPPGLAEFQELWSRFKDNVPIHWAVVDHGEISFYVFDNTHKLQVWK